MYSTILAQHLALQKMPPAVQKLQPQLVAAALGEPLPRPRGTHPHPLAPGNPNTPQPARAPGAPCRTSVAPCK